MGPSKQRRTATHIGQTNRLIWTSDHSPYTGWRVVYSTPGPTHPFVQMVLRLIRKRYSGLTAAAEYRVGEPELEVIPPERTELAESDLVGREIESLVFEAYRVMEQETDVIDGTGRSD